MATATEPAWLAGAREAARATYESLPVPTNREEAWRFTNLRGFDPDAFDVHPGTLTIEGDAAGGVTFGSLARLIAERPDLVEPHLGSVVARRREVLGWKRGPLDRGRAAARARRRRGRRSRSGRRSS